MTTSTRALAVALVLAACGRAPAPPSPDASTAGAWLRFRLDPGAPALAPTLTIAAPFASGCGLDVKQLRAMTGAVVRPARLVVDVQGAVTADAATCLLKKVATAGPPPVVSAIAGGVRVELDLAPGAPSAGDLTPPPLLPGAIAASTVFGAGNDAWTVQLAADAETQVVLVAPTEAAAKATEAWLVASIETAAPALAALKHTRDARTLTISAPSDPTLASAVRQHLVEAFRIPSASMAPTILVGDNVLVAKGAAVKTLARNELVVYRRDDHPPYVKRVVALAGDTVDDGTVVPAGHVWVLGDDRENSMDSRHEGPLPVSAIVGKPFAIYWSADAARLGALF